jgi:hypothetical protein
MPGIVFHEDGPESEVERTAPGTFKFKQGGAAAS